MTVHVLVVDDQAPFRRAMAAVVDATDGFVVVAEHSDEVREGMRAFMEKRPPRWIPPGLDEVGT